MKLILNAFVSLSCLVALGAHAATTDQWNEWQRQQKWRNVGLHVEGLDGNLTGVLTESGLLRIESFEGPIRSKAQVNSSEWGWAGFTTRAKFAKTCSMYTPIINYVRNKKNAYALEAPVVPLKNGVFQVDLGDGRKISVSGLDNHFLPYEYFEVHLHPKDGAMVLSTGLDLADVERQLAKQLQDNKDQIFGSGKISLDLTSLDDLVCDIVNGLVQIDVVATIHYSRPRLTRKAFLSPDLVENIYDQLRSKQDASVQGTDADILGSAHLALALEHSAHPMKDFQKGEYVQFFHLLFSDRDHRLQGLSRSDLVSVARRMDRISQENTWSTSDYKLDFSESNE